MSDSDGIHWFQVETLRGSVRQVVWKLSWSVHTILFGIFSKEGLLYILKPRQTRMIGLVWNSSGCFERNITTSSYAILGKVWAGSVADEKDDYGYLAILAFSEDDSTRTSQVRILSNYALHISLYSKHVINLWVELFNTQAQAW